MTRLRENHSRPKNRLGAWALALAAISVVAYAVTAVISGSSPALPLGKFWAVSEFISPAAAIASVVVGVVALARARGGAGGLGLAIAGVAVGALLTALFVIFFVGLMLNPGALGD